MKKENKLVIIIICIAVAGMMIYTNSDLAKQMDDIPGKAAGHTNDMETINWQEYDPGMELAKLKDKPVFLYFHADWCTYCVKLKETTFRDEKVLTYLRDNFISISVDTDHNQALSKQWRIKGLPTLWFLKPDNSEISNMPGYVDEKQFLQVLKYIHTQSYDTMSFHDFMKTI